MGRDGVLVPVDHDQSCLNKKTADSRSWILLDHSGHNAILDVDKYVIMRRFQIHARDLRILDPVFSYPSTILGREKVILLNLEHIKAIITAEEVLLRDPMDDNVIPIVEQLQRRLAPDNLIPEGQEQEDDVEFPFEFRALEVALEAICSYLDARTRELETDAYPALEDLISKISCHNLDRVSKLKSAMIRLTNRVRDELEQLLDNDDDMADHYLSRKLTVASLPVSGSDAPDWFHNSPTIGSKISRASRASAAAATQEDNDVEELEMLLEAHYTQIDGTLNKLITVSNMDLDKHRNQLIQVVIVSGIAFALFFSTIILYARRRGLFGS
ncbi:hypothetical protein Ddye_015993 [Dipteronia dyeriana]|uniref:Magnesium transporter n=1 Tax=Dipteronia dyeriana TaxID=168575 RepID=A0AAD9U6G8_9ROSI|nr:hypothetical protein Ddye_015993 [Dipteronia dyeriana]